MNLSLFSHKYRIYYDGSETYPYNVDVRRGVFPFYFWSLCDFFRTLKEAEEYIEGKQARDAKIGVVKYV